MCINKDATMQAADKDTSRMLKGVSFSSTIN
jgi:hypothetical protein